MREHPRAESAPPCGARPCTNPFFAPSRAILVTMAIETVRARLSREPEPRVPRAFPAAHPVLSPASTQAGQSVPTRAGQRARTRGARRARGAPRRGLRARRRVLRRDRTNPAADSLASSHRGQHANARTTRRVGKRRPTNANRNPTVWLVFAGEGSRVFGAHSHPGLLHRFR